MNDKWSYINFDSLIKEILDGKRCIQEPIVVNDSSGEKAKNVPFKVHLLCYENIHDDNLLEILHKIYMMFNVRVYKLNENENVKEMIKQVNGEWFKEEEILKLDDPLEFDFFDNCQKDKRTYEKSKKKFDEMVKLSNYEKDIPIDSKLREDYPMERELEGAILLCNKSIQNITNSANHLKEIIGNIRKTNTSTIIELSTKHRPLYNMSGGSSEDKTLPMNIHKIFSNYLHIYNLFLKQLIIYHNTLVDMIKDMEKKCSELQILKQNVNIIAHLDVDKDDLFDIVFNGIKSIFSSNDDGDNVEVEVKKQNEEDMGNIEMLIKDDEGEGEVDREDEILNYEINKLDDVSDAANVSKKLKEFF
tara:strand:+ start:2554 stop:3633 length:1080 start_codon:yes stop_codon:yes gene_type:complete